MSASPITKRIIITILLVGIFLSVLIALPRIGRYLSAQIIYNLVASETDGFYQLEFDKLDINLWERAISLQGVRLHPDSTKDFTSHGLNNLYTLELGGLVFDVKSTSSIYLKRELVIEKVRVIDPRINMVHNERSGAESFSLQTGNLYKVVSDYLSVFQVDRFDIENGLYEHYPSNFSLNNIELLVQNLLMDSTSRPDKRFFSENIELEINDQRFALRDSIHELSFNRFVLSTADSVLTFDSLKIKPVNLQNKVISPDSSYVIYDLVIPHLTLKGVDYFSAYQKDYLEIDELALGDSRIYVDAETYTNPARKRQRNNSLQGQLIDIFDRIQVGKFRLINTNLDVKTSRDRNYNFHHLLTERADIVLYDILLDSTNYRFDRAKRYFKDIDIIIKDYSSYLPDSIHRMDFDLLTVSSIDSTFIFEGFRISNNGLRLDSSALYSVDVPLLALRGINYRELLSKQMLINQVELRRPEINIENVTAKGGMGVPRLDNFYDLVKGEFQAIRIDDVVVSDGQLSVAPAISIGQFDGRIRRIELDNQTQSWNEIYEEVHLDMNEVFHEDDNNRFEARKLITSGQFDGLSVINWELNHKGSALVLDSRIDSLQLSGIQLDSILAGNYLAFDSIFLDGPSIRMELGATEKDGNLIDLGNKYLEIENGRVDITLHDSSFYRVDSLNTALNVGQNNFIYESRFDDITLHSSAAGYQLEARSLILDGSGNLTIERIDLEPVDTLGKESPQLSTSIPRLILYGLDQDSFWNKDLMKADSLSVEVTNTHINPGEIVNQEKDSLPWGWELAKIMLEGTNLSLNNRSNGSFQQIKLPVVSATLAGFHYPDHALADENTLFFSNDVEVSLSKVTPVMTNGDSLFVNSIVFSKLDKSLILNQVFYQGDGNTVMVPRTEVINPDFQSLFDRKLAVADTLLISDPQFVLTIPSEEADQTQEPISLPLQLGLLEVANSTIDLKDSVKQVDYSLGTTNIFLRGIQPSDTFSLEGLFDKEQTLLIEGSGLSLPLDDGYTLNSGSYRLQQSSKLLELGEVHLVSAFSPEDYSSRLNKQNDWFDAKAQRISFQGMDLGEWLGDERYRIHKIEVDGLETLVYRDKTPPFPEDQLRSLPQTLLRNLEQWVYLDTINMTGQITYREKRTSNSEIGEISFNDLRATLFHVSAVDSTSSRPMRLEARGKLLNEGGFEAVALFDLNDPQDRFTLVGEITELPLNSLNKMLRPAADINIRSGYSKKIWFNIKANDELAKGKMKINYSGLKVQILNPETHDTRGLGQGIKTFFANTFVVKKRNPTFLFLRDGTIFYKRDPSRAIFNYWGKALLSGAVSSVGIHKSDKAEREYNRQSRNP